MKKILRISFILILAICVIIGIRSKTYAEDLSNENQINNLINENEDNPESTKYFVTDSIISRVMPETSIETFKTNFASNEVVKVYTDSECTEQNEVKNDYVCSGMYAKYEYNGRKFRISVLGDIHSEDKLENNLNGDGILNQIELTRIIREHVKTIGWEIKDEIEKSSADVTIDKNIDKNDITSIITYIVFEGVEGKNVKIIESPKVEVISGEQNTEGNYIDNVKLKIKEENPSEETQKTIYKITKIFDNNREDSDYIQISGTQKEIVLEQQGLYKITSYTYGIEGNKSKIGYSIINICLNNEEKEERDKVARIIDAPEEYRNLIGTEYESLSNAIDKVAENKGNFIIQIIRDITDETNIVDNKEVTIDLNGCEVKAEDDAKANITVKSGGKLTIIDNTDEKIGKIVNTKGIGVKVENGGTFTLGINENNVPEDLPCIQGKTVGVKTEEGGTFNFYDGIVKGENFAIDGVVNNTPELYNSTISTNEEVKEATLKRTQVIEARIGGENYFQLEKAIEDANNIIGNSNEQITIVFESDISRGNTKIEIDNTKNIILNLNGHSITSTSEEAVIENAGKLVIADENNDQKGNIKSENSYAIVNKDNANLKIKDGINIIVGTNGYGINNRDSAECILTNCNIKTDENGYLIIFSETTLIKGRTIINNSSKQGIEIKEGQFLNSSEIYNTGNITISGGTGENTNVVNDEEGNIVINGGTYARINNENEMIINEGIIWQITNLQGSNTQIKGRKFY